jgi:hypothetical protein
MKLNRIIVAAFVAFSAQAFAQTAVTPPTAPTVPATVTVSPNATTALANSTTNRIFIDQSGANPDVNMTQDGSGNKAGSAARPIYLRGADQAIITRQIGDNNQIDLEVVNPTTGANVGAKVTIQQIGNSNKVDAACGYGNASDGTTALTGCKAADLNWKFTGNSNEFQFRGTGDDLKSAVTVAGNGNKFWIDAVGNKHTQTLMVTGDNNEFNLSQTSTGSAGSSIWIDQTGTGAKFFVAQSGTVDNVLNIKSVATGGTFNIVQKN